jgi:hypothetical protein
MRTVPTRVSKRIDPLPERLQQRRVHPSEPGIEGEPLPERPA